MSQSPMLSVPLKQTNEIDWVQPLKEHIRTTYGDDPERYAEECSTLNRLRQDMRGAGKDSMAGRDLLYRYYGQLELLDLRFPVDEYHIKISFTWFDAFTQKPTSQYSLAYEKASIIFNISAALSCHAAIQDRNDEIGQKAAYHSFQASAGMFTYINENFLHAPSTDLSRETVKTLIAVMLAQAQEVFVEKQIRDGRKVGLLAKLASQAALLYAQASEGSQENAVKIIFDKHWLHVIQIKANYLSSIAQYYQAMADDGANSHGSAITRLHVAERECKEAGRIANAFSNTSSTNANLSSETKASLLDMTARHLASISEKLKTLTKDNDFIYHQTVPACAALSVIPKLAAAKAIPVNELYQGQDIQRIIGPDIFHRIVPISVTESASLYDEEKAKLVRAEAEKSQSANDEMAASLDYLKLPDSLIVLKGGVNHKIGVDDEFRRWCEKLAGHEPFQSAFESLHRNRTTIQDTLTSCSKQLDQEESTCEKMRSKYGGSWTQQPSSRLTTTLRSDIKNYSSTIHEASTSDLKLLDTCRQYEADFDEMRSAGETGEADVLYQRAMFDAGADRGKGKSVITESHVADQSPSLLDEDLEEGDINVMDQVTKVEDLLRKLELIRRERSQVLKDLKERVHNDDISNTLILSKKSTSDSENQLFQAELDKYRPFQQRLLQTQHKQIALLKEITRIYSTLLQHKRIKSEQANYEKFTRQRNAALARYRKIFQAFNDLVTGVTIAHDFYSGMKDIVASLQQNVETFVDNRRLEGGQLLAQIERDRLSTAGSQADQERERLKGLMQRMSMSPATAASLGHSTGPEFTSKYPGPSSIQGSRSPVPPDPHYHSVASPQTKERSPIQLTDSIGDPGLQDLYHRRTPPLDLEERNTMRLPYQPPATFAHPRGYQYSPHNQPSLPRNYVPPPPPAGPPPELQKRTDILDHHRPQASEGFVQHQSRSIQDSTTTRHSHGNPWAGLDAWD